MRSLRNKLLLLWKKYERHINLGALVLGFAFDLWLAKRPDSITDNLLLLAYLSIAGTVIVLLNIKVRRRQMEREHPTEPLLLLFVLQFCFGGLASNLLILYGKSGTVGGSLLFIGLLAAFALGNEFLKGSYEQLRFNVAVYYFLLLTYCVIAVPTFLLHSIGASVFLLSCLLSVICIAFFLSILFFKVFKKKEQRQMVEVSGILIAILVIFNGLYFLNIIPPVPVSLKQGGIYHSLNTNGVGGYHATLEAPAWYIFWRDTDSQYHYTHDAQAYCFSAIFAPGKLSAPVVHTWQKYSEQRQKWNIESSVSFPINGGRDEGYRGWSVHTLTPGKWRCDIHTTRGQLIGRISFTAIEGQEPNLSTMTL